MPTSAARSVSPVATIDLARFDETPLTREPFDHLIVPGFIRAEALTAIDAAFPKIAKGGSFPAPSVNCSPLFLSFLEELQGPAVTRAFERKFDIDLTGRPTMVTLRGRSRAKDGRIHRDSKSKIITALIYMNAGWESDAGRLRLLRGPDDIEDYLAEVPPQQGTLLAFRCSDKAYHGHKPFVGERRSIQLNWITDEAVLKRELSRHGFSALLKKLSPFGR